MASVSKAAAKFAGTTKGGAKALAGCPGIFGHLAAEHAELANLMKRVADAAPDSNIRNELFPEIRKNLLAHAHAEEEQFYPILFSFAELESLVSQCADEHQRVEECLIDLESADNTAWAGLFDQLMRAVEAHVEREENELFPKARELLSREQAEELDECYSHAEERQKAEFYA
jgi:hemerythrin superfamily protein